MNCPRATDAAFTMCAGSSGDAEMGVANAQMIESSDRIAQLAPKIFHRCALAGAAGAETVALVAICRDSARAGSALTSSTRAGSTEALSMFEGAVAVISEGAFA